jgi:hypothetical protein
MRSTEPMFNAKGGERRAMCKGYAIGNPIWFLMPQKSVFYHFS